MTIVAKLIELEIEYFSDSLKSSNFQVRLIDTQQSIRYKQEKPKASSSESPTPIKFIPEDEAKANKSSLKQILSGKHGHLVTLQVDVEPPVETNEFKQTLSFPLRLAGQFACPLALQPQFIHFEDPEYNRRLASASAHSSRVIKLKNSSANDFQLYTLTLSADRREYNPESLLSVRFDLDGGGELNTDKLLSTKATLNFAKVSQSNSPTKLDFSQTQSLELGKLTQFLLQQWNLVPGDTLEVSLSLILPDSITLSDQNPIVVLKLRIVAAPVNPVPQAAYALLRKYQPESGQPDVVECVRFAWSPEPARIELVCAEDLRTEVVRRRAVFHWQDSVRMQAAKTSLPSCVLEYEIQKIASTGSTHFPWLEKTSET